MVRIQGLERLDRPVPVAVHRRRLSNVRLQRSRCRPLAHRARWSGLAAACAALVVSGCTSWRPATGPMIAQLHPAECDAQERALVMLLPGVYSDSQDFVRRGFVSDLRERRIAADAMVVDAHIGYYRNRSVVERLQADVFEPARAAGYRSVWLAGISLGGFGALLHEELQPGQAAGLVLIAPYLGTQEMVAAIQGGGGLRQWQAPEGDDVNLCLWRWLQAYTRQAHPSPPLYLGFGLDDRFAPSHQLLAANLPPQQVFNTTGGHDWPQWRRLWQQMLDALPLPRCELQRQAA